MRVIGCLWIVWACLARLAVAQTIESFDGELKKANALAERGRFGDAKSRLDELLQDCEHQDLARQRQREIIDLATLCAFQIEYPDVEAKDVVQGDLRSWNPRTGKIKVVYDANWRDFELQNGIRFHKALATGPFTLEISGSSYSNADPVQGWGPVDDQGGIYVSFGRGLNGQTYYPARAFSFDGKDWKMVDEKETSPVDPGKPFKLKYRVDDGSAKAYSSGRMLVSGRKERKQWGSWGFAGSGIERVEFTGTIEPAWIQGEIDSVRQENRRRFDRSFDSRQVLPAWLFEAAIVQVIGNGKTAERRFPGQLNDTQRRVAEQLHHLSFQRAWKSGLAELKRDGERLPAITSDWFSSVFLSGDGQVGEALKFVEAVVGADPTFYAGRALRASLLGRTRRRTESIAAWRELSKSHSGESETFEQTAFLLLEDAQLSEARETLAEAGRHGHRSDEIKALEELIYRADRGPQWGRTYRHQSAHYDISTDIDDQAARNAARVLEEALTAYSAHLVRLASTERKRFKVFLFAGESGYHSYVKSLFGAPSTHTAGLYFPLLKQLLIWNLPDNEMMERTIRHEGFHQYLDCVTGESPTWLNEGLAEYYESAGSGTWAKTGPRADHLATLAGRRHVPFEKYLFQEHDDFYRDAQMSYAQAWSIVHFLQHSSYERKKTFNLLVESLRQGKSGREALDAAFVGIELETLEADWKDYVTKLGAGAK